MTRPENRVFLRLDHTSRTGHVTAQLRGAILAGSLEPGTPLREGRLAVRFGVSRAPVREALRSLEEEGLVTKTAYRGAFVAATRHDAMDEATSVRVRVEPYAVERSLPVFIADDFRELERRLRDFVGCARSGDTSSLIDAHDSFHRVFYEYADHHLLLDAWRTLEPVIRRHLRSTDWSPSLVETWIRSHEALVGVIRVGNPPAIARAVADHITGTEATTSADHQHGS